MTTKETPAEIVLESLDREQLSEYEDIVIIDKDFCEIRIDNEEFL